MKGNIMLKAYTNLSGPAFVNKGCLVHFDSNLPVSSSAVDGFYFEVKYYLSENRAPLTLHPGIRDYITWISCKEVIKEAAVIAGGCGEFSCDSGKVSVSDAPGQPDGYLLVHIVSDSVDNFNATVNALRNGDLKPVGSEQTVVEKLRQQVDSLTQSNQNLRRYEQGYQETIHRHEQFLSQATRYLEGEEPIPRHMGDTLFDCLSIEMKRLKSETFWQKLWSLKPAAPMQK